VRQVSVVPAATTRPTSNQRATAADAPPIGADATIVVRNLSKWYGDVVAVSDVTFGVEPGVTALLGPNGAGKSTTLEMITGLLAPSTGSIRILGKPARGDVAVYRNVGLVAEQETLYPFMTAREFIRLNAVLQKLPDPDGAAERALGIVELLPDADRDLRGYSKGMRQRTKVAAALVHDPGILLMDEPLNGTDPLQRARLIELIRALGRQGKTVLVSSHILHEVERFADRILVINRGKLAAAGDYRAIRDKIDEHARQVRIRCSDARRLAGRLVQDPAIVALRFESGIDDGQPALVAETSDVRAFYRSVPAAAQQLDIHLYEVAATDDSLASVFAYVVGR
jgi:ABC-2 type transport system ATP-binding protein